MNEAYAKYQYDLLFEHINLTYRDLVSKVLPLARAPLACYRTYSTPSILIFTLLKLLIYIQRRMAKK